MLFLKISNADISFNEKTLMWKTYTTNEALFTIKQVQIINSEEFVIAALDNDSNMFIVYVAIREQEKMPIHFKK